MISRKDINLGYLKNEKGVMDIVYYIETLENRAFDIFSRRVYGFGHTKRNHIQPVINMDYILSKLGYSEVFDKNELKQFKYNFASTCSKDFQQSMALIETIMINFPETDYDVTPIASIFEEVETIERKEERSQKVLTKSFMSANKKSLVRG